MIMMHEGGCLCGSVQFSIQGEPVSIVACHCPACQRRTGSLFSVGAAVEGFQVRSLEGELAVYRSFCDGVNSSPNLTHLAVLISNLKLTHPQRFLSVI